MQETSAYGMVWRGVAWCGMVCAPKSRNHMPAAFHRDSLSSPVLPDTPLKGDTQYEMAPA